MIFTTSSLPTCPLREEKSFSQRAFSIYTDIRKLQDKAKTKTSYTLSTRRLRFGYTFIMGFGLPVDFQAVDEYNKYQWRIAGFHSSTYIIYIKTYIIRVPNCCKRVRKSCF